jgi:hypothetical protein
MPNEWTSFFKNSNILSLVIGQQKGFSKLISIFIFNLIGKFSKIHIFYTHNQIGVLFAMLEL